MTQYSVLIDRFLRRIERDSDFFSYYNVTALEKEAIIQTQAVGYLHDAMYTLCSRCIPDVDLLSFDDTNARLGVDLTEFEIGMVAALMYQVYLERQEAMLGAFKLRMSPSDMNTFSPANERSSFLKLVADVRHENDITISRYCMMDRLTNQPKYVDYTEE